VTNTNPKTLHKINIFVSSPGDVSEERRRVKAVIDRLGQQEHIKPQLQLNPLLWEVVPPEGGKSPQAVIDKYLGEAGKADIYLCILWHRMGTPTTNAQGESFRSGTECEFFSSYRANQATSKPFVLLYHCQRAE